MELEEPPQPPYARTLGVLRLAVGERRATLSPASLDERGVVTDRLSGRPLPVLRGGRSAFRRPPIGSRLRAKACARERRCDASPAPVAQRIRARDF